MRAALEVPCSESYVIYLSICLFSDPNPTLLFHWLHFNRRGGIARNVFSPILSGGGVVLCPGFDPILFWDLLSAGRQEGRCTWYYASPTMHQAYVEEAASRAKSGTLPTDPGIRFIANAAGALLPALAERMKTTFNCSILPGYGMTECSKYSDIG